jgi:CrcB protein
MRDIILVAFGGAAGSVLRFGLGRLTTHPYGTLTSNLLACLVLGYLTARLAGTDHEATYVWRLLIGIGFCGGLSTFSTLMMELATYAQKGQLTNGLGYVFGSFVLGIVAILGGMYMAKFV